MEFDNPTIVLCDKRWIDMWKSSVAPLMLALVVMAVTFFIALTTIFPDALWSELPVLLARKLGTIDWPHALLRRFDLLIMLGTAFVHSLYLYRAQQLERLTLSPEGIRYTSPLPHIFKRLNPDWSLSWDQVRKIELGTLNTRPRNAEFALLTLISPSGKQRIFPSRWVDANNYTRPKFRFKFAFTLSHPPRDEALKSAMASEIARYISRHVPHLAIDSTSGNAETFTSLEKNPHGRIALGIVALLICYAFVDMIVGPDAYIDEPASLLHIYISAGVIGAILSGIWLSGSSLPLGEKTGLALLIGMLVGVALIPGALRINAFTDTEAGVTHEYFVKLNADGVLLQPVVEGMPVIDYFARNKFWEKFGANDTYPVQIRKGILGFYQFNSSAIVNDIHRHERND